MIIIDIPQKTPDGKTNPEWLAYKAGKVSASNVYKIFAGKIVSPSSGLSLIKQVDNVIDKYLCMDECSRLACILAAYKNKQCILFTGPFDISYLSECSFDESYVFVSESVN